MTRAEVLAENLRVVRARIAAAEARAGRAPGSVKLVAVSKKMPAEDVVAAMAAEQLDFGENYAQELRDKRVQALALAQGQDLRAPRWHFIGPLQANKVKYVAGHAALVHALDTPTLLDELDRKVPDGQIQDCLVQVNVALEAQKRGVSADALPAMLDHFARCPRLRCVGLMLIPPLQDDPEHNRPHFRELRRLLDQERTRPRPGVALTELSMGMSEDLEVAVEEGATLVRVGTAIFGPRPSG